MTVLEELKDESLHVDNLLTQYIDLHNAFLKSTGTFMSLFRKIDFKRLTGDSYFLFEKLRDERNKLEQLKDRVQNNQEREFAGCLFLYAKALTETVYLLFIMFNALKEKAEGNKLSLSEHMENNKKYQKSIEVYMSYGNELNKLYHAL